MTEAQLTELDDLDRLSVELHRVYHQKAAELRKQGFHSATVITEIQSIIRHDPKASAAFREWCSCIREIWNGDAKKINLYTGLRDTFVCCLQTYTEEQRKELERHILSLQMGFSPILASEQYRNWKNSDIYLIENIPFILTYSTEICMEMPLETADLADTLEAITKINPAHIIWTYDMDHQKGITALESLLYGFAKYMDRKKLRAKADLYLYYEILPAAGENKRLERNLFAYTNNRLSKIEHYPKKGGIMKVSAQAPLSETWKNILPYIPARPFLTINDLDSFDPCAMEVGTRSEFYDCYDEMWTLYLRDSMSWKKTCSVLKSYMDKADRKAQFVIKSDEREGKSAEATEIKHSENRTGHRIEYSWILPLACRSGALKIVEALKAADVIGVESDVVGYTSDSCEVRVYAGSVHDVHCAENASADEFARLFADYKMLLLPDSISVRNQKEEGEGESTTCVQVLFDGLDVTKMDVPASGRKQVVELLHFCAARRWISNFRLSEGGMVDFVFATGSHKKLLTREDRIKEIYLYHALRESGNFDDVASDVTITFQQDAQGGTCAKRKALIYSLRYIWRS